MLCVVGASFKWLTSWWWAVAAVIGFFLLEYGYFATVEILRGGQTLGKWTLELRVVTREGGAASRAAFLIRNAVRSLDLVLGVPLMATDPLARRLGDRLAGTLVVHTRATAAEAMALRTPAGWSGQEVAVLEAFLRRAPTLEKERAVRLASQLLWCIEHDDPGLVNALSRDTGPVEALNQLLRAND